MIKHGVLYCASYVNRTFFLFIRFVYTILKKAKEMEWIWAMRYQ